MNHLFLGFLGTSLSLLIFLFSFFIPFIIDLDFLKAISNDLNKTPLFSLSLSENSSCSNTEIPISIFSYPGIIEGCDCSDIFHRKLSSTMNNKISRTKCGVEATRVGCKRILKINQTNFYSWNNHTFCTENYKEMKYVNLVKMSVKSNEKCQNGMKRCGIIDTINQILCLPENEECPINHIVINNKELMDVDVGKKIINNNNNNINNINSSINGSLVNGNNSLSNNNNLNNSVSNLNNSNVTNNNNISDNIIIDPYHGLMYKTISLGNGKYLHYTNKAIDKKIIINLKVSDKQPCANPNYYNSISSPYILNKNYNKYFCKYKYDGIRFDYNKYFKIDSQLKANLFIENNLFDKLISLPKYNAKGFFYNTNLYGETFYGFQKEIFSELKNFDKDIQNMKYYIETCLFYVTIFGSLCFICNMIDITLLNFEDESIILIISYITIKLFIIFGLCYFMIQGYIISFSFSLPEDVGDIIINSFFNYTNSYIWINDLLGFFIIISCFIVAGIMIDYIGNEDLMFVTGKKENGMRDSEKFTSLLIGEKLD